MKKTIHLGISTCPNDTFAFHGILENKVDTRGLNFHIELLDVQQLNHRLLEGDFDVAKASFHAALLMSHQLGVFSSGAALGFGVGPLILASDVEKKLARSEAPDARITLPTVLCPGEQTTATLLFKLFHPDQAKIRHAVFSEIMPALKEKRADFGVCIHEGRFTWQEQGLAFVEDLGDTWETATQTPLPLGGILGRLNLEHDLLFKTQAVIHDSILYAQANRDETRVTMRKYAQEFSDEVLFSHVDLYVNDWTVDLGEQGKAALLKLHEIAQSVELLSHEQPALKVISAADIS